MAKPDELRMRALQATERAHAPYSRFAVVAAIEDASGTVHVGANIECMSYPLGACAEATAIGHMVMAGSSVIRQVAVIARNHGAGDRIEADITPCGGCRQRLAEFGTAETLVHLCNADGVSETWRLGDLFPAGFTAELGS